jgi:branched-chain amino acid transport system substrate-binding protein
MGCGREGQPIAMALGLALGLASAAGPVLAGARYDPGASDTEIKIGHIVPYSGLASPYSVIGKTEAAYFEKINAEGGINGRKIRFISYDDAYNPAKTMEQTRRLVESDEVLLVFNSLGTPTNTAIQKYLNGRKVPQLFVASGATKWNDPRHFPWTMGWQPSYQSEARIYAHYLLEHHPRGTIGVVYQNDDYGKDYLKGLKDGIAGGMPIIEMPYDAAATTLDSELVSLRASGVDVLFNVSGPKFVIQIIRKLVELDWRPVHVLNNVSTAIGSVMKPAGPENARGVLSTSFLKDPADPAWAADPGLRQWRAFMDRYYPDGDRSNYFTVYGYSVAQTLAYVLGRCGDDLTRANVMKHAADLRDLELPMLLPGIKINTGPDDYAPIEQMQMMRFTGESWELFGPILRGAAEGSGE